MKKIIPIILFTLIHAGSIAQTATDSVKKVIDKLFVSMKSADSTGLLSCFSQGAILQTISKDKAGNVSVKDEQVSAFARQIATLSKDDADERITYDVIKIDADLAIVWTPYQFFYKGNFSHCGVNSFQLVRIGSEWKIQYLIDTRRKTGCL